MTLNEFRSNLITKYLEKHPSHSPAKAVKYVEDVITAFEKKDPDFKSLFSTPLFPYYTPYTFTNNNFDLNPYVRIPNMRVEEEDRILLR
jgi:hypothetical protein